MNKLYVKRQAHYKYDSNKFIKRKQENNFLSKKPKEKSFGLKAFGFVFLVFIIGFIVVAYVHQFIEISTTNYQIQSLEEKLANLQAENEKIKLQIAQTNSLSNIDKNARELYGMVEPDQEDILYIHLNDATKEQAEVSIPPKGGNKVVHIANEVVGWLKNLTSVEAGTLDD